MREADAGQDVRGLEHRDSGRAESRTPEAGRTSLVGQMSRGSTGDYITVLTMRRVWTFVVGLSVTLTVVTGSVTVVGYLAYPERRVEDVLTESVAVIGWIVLLVVLSVIVLYLLVAFVLFSHGLPRRIPNARDMACECGLEYVSLLRRTSVLWISPTLFSRH
jgi:hypothetical protein